jgi:superfamily II DNA or RNA helicase
VLTPRPYQIAAVDEVMKRWRAFDSTLLVSATGTGKSLMAAMIAQRVPKDRRFLILLNRTELLWQFKRTIEAYLPDVVEIEAGTMYATHPGDRGFHKNFCGRIVLGMLQSMCQKRRLLSWNPREFGHIIADEAHHFTTVASSSRHVLDHFRDYKLCGLTATADRHDGVSLVGFFRSVAYDYDISAAIREGWLVPIRQQREILKGWDLSSLKRSRCDFSDAELDSKINQEKPSQAIASAAIKWAEAGGARKPCLIFAVSIAHAHLIADILNRHRGGCAVALDGTVDRDDRRPELERFHQGEFQYLVGADLFLEGFDDDTIEVVVMGRPTRSRARYAQAIGRGTRPHHSVVPFLNEAKSAEERKYLIRISPKPCLTVVDMVGVSSELKLRLPDGFDILGGYLPERVRDAAREIVRDGLGKPEIDEALEQAIEILDRKEKERRRGIILGAKLHSREVDPFDLLDIRPRREPYVLRGKKPTDRQLAYLARNDVPVPQDASFWQAKTLIDGLIVKRNAGPPTPAMAAALKRLGRDPSAMNFLQASRALDEANGKPTRRGRRDAVG